MKSKPTGISVFSGAVANCAEVVQWLEDNKSWDRSTIVDAKNETIIDDHRTSTTASFPLLSFLNPACVHEMNGVVWRALDEYARQWDFPFIDVEPVSVQRYEPGERYGVHVDAGPGLPRVCSALVYLNTVEVGGETYFPHFDYAIKPTEGTLVVFPSNYVYAHEARPPVSGMKYAAAYWARGQMYRWKATQHLLGVRQDGEVFDANWMDRDTVQMPPSKPWTENRSIRFEDVDIWEVICESSGLSGVYAAWCPYAEYYIVLERWSIVAEFDGPDANARLEQYLIAKKIPYPYVPPVASTNALILS